MPYAPQGVKGHDDDDDDDRRFASQFKINGIKIF
jgi:hypothetical protein